MNNKIDEFKSAMRLFPASVAIISTGQAPNRIGMTATAVCSLTADPPQLLVCLNGQTATSQAIRETKTFTINLLADSQEDLAIRFAGMMDGIVGDSKFLDDQWRESEICEGQPTAPVLKDALYSFSCRLVSMHEEATHFIVVGAVEEVQAGSETQTLIYGNGSFGSFQPFPKLGAASTDAAA